MLEDSYYHLWRFAASTLLHVPHTSPTLPHLPGGRRTTIAMGPVEENGGEKRAASASLIVGHTALMQACRPDRRAAACRSAIPLYPALTCLCPSYNLLAWHTPTLHPACRQDDTGHGGDVCSGAVSATACHQCTLPHHASTFSSVLLHLATTGAPAPARSRPPPSAPPPPAACCIACNCASPRCWIYKLCRDGWHGRTISLQPQPARYMTSLPISVQYHLRTSCILLCCCHFLSAGLFTPYHYRLPLLGGAWLGAPLRQAALGRAKALGIMAAM